ncbi:MAG: PDR/VanB family oxidoreductase [Burkholderiales bacterium]|nr:PDR/VanB family oxidoreductase [Burkholderiales bacterium]
MLLEVSDVRAEALDVLLVELRAAGGGPLEPFEPGAHLEFELPNGLIRHYSLTNDWRERDRYVVGVGRAANGRGGSDFIHQSLRRGGRLTASAPRNNFALDPAAASYLFVAGGIGVTPIMSMVRRCAAEGRDWRLVYAARNAQRAAFYETLRAFGDRVHFHFDDQAGAVLDARRWLATRSEGQHVYCCGPQPLMRAVREGAAHYPPDCVHFEYFVGTAAKALAEAPAAGTGEGEFRVDLKRSKLSLVVPAELSILEVLEANGVKVPFSCREGLCRTCETTVCEGEVEHRDYVLSAAERAESKTMMVCVSRSRSAVLVLDR